MTLFPFLHAHKETTNFSNSTSMEIEFPLENWIHVGCEVCFRSQVTQLVIYEIYSMGVSFPSLSFHYVTCNLPLFV